MAGGLAALLDDVAALARAAAASVDDVGAAATRASVKATGVVVDDTAVTPRYVEGIDPKRELPIIRKIATGSIRNKLLIILPAIMLLSQFLPWIVMPILMIGGCYLSFEGAEKLWEALRGGHVEESNEGKSEDQITSGAIRTDFILSAEIMVISLKEVEDEPFLSRLVILVVVALIITALVYGVVALIVKMDDVGLHLRDKAGSGAQRIGNLLVNGMPKVLSVLSTVGIAAMLWVGGHILLMGLDDVGWHWPYAQVHHLEHAVHEATGAFGGVLGWLTNTLCSAAVGLVVGAVIVAVVHQVVHRRHQSSESAAH
ncbi:DUF808 domain-containing protein [Luteipulveratus flavus]|uniref:DUF808 domain-containing protein n=1 Tax=Luteipulveratus flavus TaxID=3031728 RepID=A0ABT6C4D8_9MICO|nr:DUF808 domain-containing protein [Luteipulveratus sp. YIM 133296]MDF8262914.1 DUF808 domain-containing protein [Luteipulveratus sp. YIM 133296]